MYCLLHFFQDPDWYSFRYAELNALLVMHGVEPSTAYEFPSRSDSPYIYINLPSKEVAEGICRRSVLIRAIYQHIAAGETMDSLVATTHQNYDLLVPYVTSSATWSITVSSFNRSLSATAKTSFRNQLQFLPFQGTVNLRSPELPFFLLLEYVPLEKHQLNEPEELLPPPLHCYFGLALAHGGMHEEAKKYDLRRRCYLGPTSLDHRLTFIMCNIARISAGHFVLDPFVGTASILVGASHFHAICTGYDIDIRVLKGAMHAGKQTSEKDRGIFNNFKCYNLPLPDLIRMDNHQFDRHMQSNIANTLDAIITDPPYGIRAGAKKSGRDGVANVIPDDRRNDLIPCTQNYAVEDVMLDLLHVAATALKMGGRLLYLIPTPVDFSEADLPMHPCLHLDGMCVQPLSTRHSRHLVIMTKTREYSTELRSEYRDYCYNLSKESGFGALMGKLQRALAVDAHQNDLVVKQVGKRCQRRKDGKAKRDQLRKEGKMGKEMRDRMSENSESREDSPCSETV